MRSASLFFCPHHRQMNKGSPLLFGRQTVEKIKQGNLIIFGCRLYTFAVIAYFFPPDYHRAPISRFREGEDIVVSEAYSLPDFMGNGDSSSFAQDTKHFNHLNPPRFHRSFHGTDRCHIHRHSPCCS